MLPLFARRTKELGALLPEPYLHGLAEGDFELAMRGLLGEGAPLSKSSIRRLGAGWTAEFEEWSQRRLEGREVVYVWADGIYVKAGLERDKAALLVVLGAMRDGTKEVLALRSGYRESVESWSEVLRDLKARGIEAPRLLMADGNAAIWGAVRQVWPEAGEQRCWNHKMRNVLDRLPQREQSETKDLLRAVVYAPSRAEAVKAREVFARRYRPWYPKAVDVLCRLVVEALDAVLKRKDGHGSLAEHLMACTDKRRGEQYGRIISSIKQLAGLKHHHFGEDNTFTRAEALALVRVSEALVLMVGELSPRLVTESDADGGIP